MTTRLRAWNLVLAVIFAVVLTIPAHAAPQSVLFSQSDDGHYGYVSQNDTGGTGLFAVVYDNFSLAANYNITQVQWFGGYFGPKANITAWTLQFYSDSACSRAPSRSIRFTFPATQTKHQPVPSLIPIRWESTSGLQRTLRIGWR